MDSNNIVFLLGAGASVNAGVPDTYSFVKEFVNSIDQPQQKELLIKIITILKRWKGEDVDIELLIEAMIKLDNKDDEPLVQFYQGSGCVIEDFIELKSLITSVRDFIKQRSIVSEEKILYYQPLLNIISEYKGQDIITLNYNICLEQFCNRNRLNFTDGFDVYWNPENFNKDSFSVRIYKLHGSVMWYQSETGRYLKIPIMTNQSKVKLITGEVAFNLMMYPMQKMDYPEPLLELLVLCKNLLVDKCKILIIVGYSFRDDSIRRMVLDVTSKNPNIHVVLIDKYPHIIYANKLKYYDKNNRIPSPIKDKVICLPYKFEKLLPYIKNHYISKLNEIITEEQRCINMEIKGEKSNWSQVADTAAEIEYVDKVVYINENKNRLTTYVWTQRANIVVKCLVNQYFTQGEYVLYFEHEIDDLFKDLLKIKCEVGLNSVGIFYIQYHYAVTGSSFFELKSIMESIDNLISFIENKKELAFEADDRIDKLKDRLINISNYFKELKSTQLLTDYFELRKDENLVKSFDVDRYKNAIILQSTKEEFNKLNELIDTIEKQRMSLLFRNIIAK